MRSELTRAFLRAGNKQTRQRPKCHAKFLCARQLLVVLGALNALILLSLNERGLSQGQQQQGTVAQTATRSRPVANRGVEWWGSSHLPQGESEGEE